MRMAESLLTDSPVGITRENQQRAYGVNALVYRNQIKGFVDFHLSWRKRQQKRNEGHVIVGEARLPVLSDSFLKMDTL
jgi:hypothetical protein